MTTNVVKITTLLTEDTAALVAAETSHGTLRSSMLKAQYAGNYSIAASFLGRLQLTEADMANARSQFSARTEMLQHIDLAGHEVEDLISLAMNTGRTMAHETADRRAEKITTILAATTEEQ